MIEVVSLEQADQMLGKVGLQLGPWNEVTDQPDRNRAGIVSVAAPEGAVELYVCAQNLSTWLDRGSRVLFQLDNSTFPSVDEVEVFQTLGVWSRTPWEPEHQRSLRIDVSVAGASSAVCLFIFFSLLFKWHVYLISEECCDGERLGLLDGNIHFFAKTGGLKRAESMVREMAENPLMIA